MGSRQCPCMYFALRSVFSSLICEDRVHKLEELPYPGLLFSCYFLVLQSYCCFEGFCGGKNEVVDEVGYSCPIFNPLYSQQATVVLPFAGEL